MPLTTVPAPGSLPFLHHLEQESARFRAALAAAPAAAPVPSCPDWDADDLIWHLAEVQWFWGQIAQDQLTRGEQLADLDAIRPSRPDDRAGLLIHYDEASTRLHRVLADLPPETELWMWASDHTAGYIQRRQAHEALIHRIDAELTAGVDRAPIDSRLAADGVDEALRIMRCYEDEDGFTATPTGPPVTILAIDVGRAWTVRPVHVLGVDGRGTSWDEQRFLVLADNTHAARSTDQGPAQVRGSAADLDCWLWNRPPTGSLERQGDPAALASIDAVVTGPIS
ncbi:MAG: maleylpyruvate isomerase N-terminal domain-containing protein [Dermatophilaceae bacterium]